MTRRGHSDAELSFLFYTERDSKIALKIDWSNKFYPLIFSFQL